MLQLPDHERDALVLLGHFFLNQGQADRALTVFSGLEVLEPGRLEHARASAVAALASGRPERALLALERLALAGLVDATFHLARALALGEMERVDDAQTAMRAWLTSRASASVTEVPRPLEAAA